MYSGLGGLFIGNNPNAKQVSGLGFGEAHSEANQNINNLRYIYNDKNSYNKWRRAEEIIKRINSNNYRQFNIVRENK